VTELGHRTWPELDGPPSVTLLVPVGSTEQHGPHLPLDTDTRIADAVARGAADRLGPGTVVAPPVGFAAAGEHETFPGTVSIGRDALRAVLVELGRSACRWARRLVFVNGHGGNLAVLTEVVELHRAEGRDARWFGCAPPAGFPGDAHAGRAETSLMLALAPELVRLDQATAGNVEPLPALLPRLRAGGVRAVSANGVLGDPTGASAEEGAALLAALVTECARFVG
jgi:mycofactocin system creatininase family protein